MLADHSHKQPNKLAVTPEQTKVTPWEGGEVRLQGKLA